MLEISMCLDTDHSPYYSISAFVCVSVFVNVGHTSLYWFLGLWRFTNIKFVRTHELNILHTNHTQRGKIILSYNIFGWHSGWAIGCRATCCVFNNRSTNCFDSGCHVYQKLYDYRRTHDTEENPNVGQRLKKKYRIAVVALCCSCLHSYDVSLRMKSIITNEDIQDTHSTII